MKKIRWAMIKVIESVGWPGMAALLLLCVALSNYVIELRPLQVELRQLALDHPSNSNASQIAANKPGGELEQFKTFFREKDLESQLQGVHKAGDSTGIVIKRIEYRMLDEKRAQLKQYQIVMPVTNSYPVIRRFIGEVLHAVPTMSLDHIAFNRKRVGDPVVDAELRFTLFLADPT